MRLPIRRSEKLQTSSDDGPLYITQEGLNRLKQKRDRIEHHDLPQAIADVRTTGELGDFSENAEYQEAKWRMRRLHGQVARLTDQIKRALVIEQPSTDLVSLGSTVVLEKNEVQTTFQIVGPHEADPARGRISHVSPLGTALMGKRVGETANGFLIKQLR